MSIEELLRDLAAQVENGLRVDDRFIARIADRVRLAAQAEIWDEMRAIDTAQVSVAMQRIDSRARARLSKGGRRGE